MLLDSQLATQTLVPQVKFIYTHDGQGPNHLLLAEPLHQSDADQIYIPPADKNDSLSS